ncbi:MAG: zinc-dependent metalloprotease [Pirellulaceae bacterium]|nr:zinc-dependent metalloprotease [Pirellulaceae bacterium]
MKNRLFQSCLILLALSGTFAVTSNSTSLLGQDKKEEAKAPPQEGQSPPQAAAPEPPHVKILAKAKKHTGLINVYQKGNSLFAELMPKHFSGEFIVIPSIARGISQGELLGGMSLGFDNEFILSFRKVEDKVHLVRKNVRFKAKKGSPLESAVHRAYTDSILFSLPIVAKGPEGGQLVDLGPVFMSDLPQLSQQLPGFMFAGNRSTWASIKNFENNAEIQVAATYASGGVGSIPTVIDSRALTIHLHYSISRLPTTGYVPRLADDRVGYFLTTVKDFSSSDPKKFVRLINRWNLQKSDPSAEKSPPKKPIIFWIENTVPFAYRKPIRDGILEWNTAFEKAGILNAIEVRQQPADADWDPEDINYNTFRWITADAGMAMGPSRTNPYTGEILDADIIFDGGFIDSWRGAVDNYDMAGQGEKSATALGKNLQRKVSKKPGYCRLTNGMAEQFAIGYAAAANTGDEQKQKELLDRLIYQGLKEVAMHEVGHTLGLRHNFKASTYYTLEELNALEPSEPILTSVMDYAPVNLVPKGKKQGNFYTTTLGPYDEWAIKYGYSTFAGGTFGEVEHLQKIASESGKAEYLYSTDEDTTPISPDPYSNRFDNGKDLLEYARNQSTIARELIPGLVDRMVKKGDDYTKATSTFAALLRMENNAMHFASRLIGGIETSRTHKGDPGSKPPFQVIPAAKQREALQFLSEKVFAAGRFDFPPELYNQLGSHHWYHWGEMPPEKPDLALHQLILAQQDRILAQLLAAATLERLSDSQLRVAKGEKSFTTGELFEGLTKSIFSELDNQGDLKITSIRRNLQDSYIRQLSQIGLGNMGAPKESRTMARYIIRNLAKKIDTTLENENIDLDLETAAHLSELQNYLEKVLDADLPDSGQAGSDPDTSRN